MNWFKRPLTNGEDLEPILDEYGALFLGCRCPDGMVLGIGKTPGEPDTLYATFPSPALARALDFVAGEAPKGAAGLIGHDESLAEAFPAGQ
jgi:hypothetical protein